MITRDLSIAIDHLQRGEVIGLPTETVYGLAGNAFDPQAIQKIYTIKQRPASNPLIVHVGSIDQVNRFVISFPAPLRELAERFWPGPLTLLLKKTDDIPNMVTAGSDRVAIRIPDHPLTLALLNQLDFPLVAPSANPYTKVSPTRAEEVESYFGDQVPVVLQGGACDRGLESTIVGMEGDRVVAYRLGSLPIEQLESVVGKIELRNQDGHSTPAPGMAKKHYSPRTPLVITEDIDRYIKEHPEERIGVFVKGTEDPETLAPLFYSRLQHLDKSGYDVLIAKHFAEKGLGRTLNDRLKRAAEE
ncbi:MAG: L-threonylcarbamoyladenylate synthase [Bacteroidota bacterium]